VRRRERGRVGERVREVRGERGGEGGGGEGGERGERGRGREGERGRGREGEGEREREREKALREVRRDEAECRENMLLTLDSKEFFVFNSCIVKAQSACSYIPLNIIFNKKSCKDNILQLQN
jgi:hypothetical protein